MSDSYVYRPLSGLTRVVVVLLILGVASSAVDTYSSYQQLAMLNRANFSPAEAEANDNRQQAIGVLSLVIRLVTVVGFGMWIVRANRNVRALGARSLPIKPGWAVGYFFVPILGLFRPYQAMRDLTKASRNPQKWRNAPASLILPFWWTFWLISNFVNQISLRITLAAKDVPSLKDATNVQIVAELTEFPLCLTATILVLLVTRLQETSFASHATEEWPADHWKGAAREDDARISTSEDEDRFIT